MTIDKNIPRTLSGWFTALLATVVIIALLPPILLFLAIRTTFYTLILIVIWMVWLPRGKDVLVIYSNSPHWQEYFETMFIPGLRSRCRILNWSDRKRWYRRSLLPELAFDGFAGEREYNPLAIVFKPFRWPRRFRFYKAFHDLKHGNQKTIRTTIDQLSNYLNAPIPYPEIHPRTSA